MKLRQHLREIQEGETYMGVEENSEIDTSQAGPSTEEDLVGKYLMFFECKIC